MIKHAVVIAMTILAITGFVELIESFLDYLG